MLAELIVDVVSIGLAVYSKDADMCRALLVQTRSIDLALDWGSMYGNIQSVSDIAPNAITPVDSKSQDATLRDSTFFRERLAKICSIYRKRSITPSLVS